MKRCRVNFLLGICYFLLYYPVCVQLKFSTSSYSFLYKSTYCLFLWHFYRNYNFVSKFVCHFACVWKATFLSSDSPVCAPPIQFYFQTSYWLFRWFGRAFYLHTRPKARDCPFQTELLPNESWVSGKCQYTRKLRCDAIKF